MKLGMQVYINQYYIFASSTICNFRSRDLLDVLKPEISLISTFSSLVFSETVRDVSIKTCPATQLDEYYIFASYSPYRFLAEMGQMVTNTTSGLQRCSETYRVTYQTVRLDELNYNRALCRCYRARARVPARVHPVHA